MPTPATQYNPTPNHYTLYSTASQPISPVSSTTATPQASSPTSPRSALNYLPVHTRQLRPPKSPLYVPAVLRPTEPPRRIKSTPLTPPPSTHGSFESPGLSRSDTGDSGKWGLGKIVENEWTVKDLGRVTDLPSRDHWKVYNILIGCHTASNNPTARFRSNPLR
jgi:hypothetical protein